MAKAVGVTLEMRERAAIRIQACREASGITMPDLVRRTGASRATLYGLESAPGDSARSQYPGAVLLFRLARVYGVEPEWLAGMEEGGQQDEDHDGNEDRVS